MAILDFSSLLCAAAIISTSFRTGHSATYTPITPGSLDNSFNFLMHGDWGWNSFNQTLTAYEMGVYGWLVDAEFVIALGDNVWILLT